MSTDPALYGLREEWDPDTARTLPPWRQVSDRIVARLDDDAEPEVARIMALTVAQWLDELGPKDRAMVAEMIEINALEWKQ